MDNAQILSLQFDAPDKRQVHGERATLPAVQLDRWLTGYRLSGTMASWRRQVESPAPHALVADSVRISGLRSGEDFAVQTRWGALAALTEEAAARPVSIDYAFSLRRVDSVVRDNSSGTVSVVRGLGHLTVPVPPALPSGSSLVANVFVPAESDPRGLTVSRVTAPSEAIEPRVTTTGLGDARRALAAGDALRITCVGDSVTGGCDASTDSSAFPALLGARLSKLSSRPRIDVSTASVGGSTTADWLGDSRRDCDWSRVDASKPDVVVVEFVNDAGLSLDELAENYGEILRRVESIGAALVLTTPHWVMPEWMSFTPDGIDDRPYVRFLRDFAARNRVALADVSASWQQLDSHGLHFETLLQNGINHPDDRGHELAASTIAACFV